MEYQECDEYEGSGGPVWEVWPTVKRVVSAAQQ